MPSVSELQSLPVEEKIKRLSPEDKEYLKGYMDHALSAYKRIENIEIIRSRTRRTAESPRFDERFLGVDIGSSSVKVLVFAGERRYKAREYYPAGTSPFEHDTQIVAETVSRALGRLFDDNGVDPSTISGIGLSGHGPSAVFIDKDGTPLTPIVTWQDRRALEEAALLKELWPGFQKDATSLEAKLFWFYRHYPALFEPGITYLDPKSYFAYLLCGKRTIDLSTATTILYYDHGRDAWDTGATGVPARVMPEVVPSWSEIGRTCTDFSRACGLPDGIPVYPGGIDAFCEAVGAGGFLDDVVVDGSGTSTCLTRSVDTNLSRTLHVLPDAAILIDTLSSTGASYQWFKECFAGMDMDALEREIDPAKPVNLLFLPYLSGERSPVWDEKARGVFLGMDSQTTAAQMLQALFQGVGFAIRHNVERMGGDIKTIRAVGGVNRNDKWLQIKANICGVRFERMMEQDASAFGAAIIAAVGSGAYTKEDCDGCIKAGGVFEPDLSVKASYDALFAIYKDMYGALKDTFRSLYHCGQAEKR